MSKDHAWLVARLPVHTRLTEAIVPLISGILKAEGIGTLAVTGRTKTLESATEKIAKKNYDNPELELMDLTGCRVIVFLQSDVQRSTDALAKSLRVDAENSLDKDKLLSVNRIGYRSVHLICDIGPAREGLQEYQGLAGLKFEVQIRTVLQHAWAELEHDKNYKFSPGLPAPMIRQLNLHAGLLELADRGLDKLSQEIDAYTLAVRKKTLKGELDTPIDSLSLDQFMEQWTVKNGLQLDKQFSGDLSDLINELRAFGIDDLAQLQEIVPEKYAETLIRHREGRATIYAMVRDWMLIRDWRKLSSKVSLRWKLPADDWAMFGELMTGQELEAMYAEIGTDDEDDGDED